MRRLGLGLRGVLPALFLLCGAPAGLEAAPAEVALSRGAGLAVMAPYDPPSAAAMALNDLRAFLQRSADLVIQTYPPATDLSGVQEPVVVLFGPATDPAVAARLKTSGLSVEGLGKEGALVHTTRLEGRPAVILAGATWTGASHAVYSFLETEVGVGFFLDGDQIPRPDRLIWNADRREVPQVPVRGLFHHYIWKHPLANNWRLWSWERWRQSIDWMRRKRFNTLPIVHDDGGYFWGDVIFRAFPEIPLNRKTLSQFVVDPRWRTELVRKVFRYSRDSGISLAYNLFYSQVPEFFADYHPELSYHGLNMRNVGIDAHQPEIKTVMKKFWGEILKTYGVDDSHIYLICSYKHERELPPDYPNHNVPTRQAIEVIKELDPQARVFIETWCWKYRHDKQRTIEKLTENAGKEWKVFHQEMPPEVGVVEWDLFRNHATYLPPGFEGRPYLQLTHSTMENWWPPSTTRGNPQWMIDYFKRALDSGAQGVLFFHIQAGTNELLADLAARIGWTKPIDLQVFYLDYARRRFGEAAAGALAESLSMLHRAVDFGATAESRDIFISLVPPAYDGSAEANLLSLELQGAERRQWLEQRLALYGERAKIAEQSVRAARAWSYLLKDDPFFQAHMWELDYVTARFEGIDSVYRAHLIASEDPKTSAALFARAVESFQFVKNLFRDRKDYHMSEIRRLEPEVPYTSAFLADWETRGHWEPRSRSMHVVWERFDEFEARLRRLDPLAGQPVR